MTDPVPSELTAPEITFLGSRDIDSMAGLIFSLAMEVSVLTARVRAMETALGETVTLDPSDAGAIAEREALLDRLMANLRQSETRARPLVAERSTTTA